MLIVGLFLVLISIFVIVGVQNVSQLNTTAVPTSSGENTVLVDMTEEQILDSLQPHWQPYDTTGPQPGFKVVRILTDAADSTSTNAEDLTDLSFMGGKPSSEECQKWSSNAVKKLVGKI